MKASRACLAYGLCKNLYCRKASPKWCDNCAAENSGQPSIGFIAGAWFSFFRGPGTARTFNVEAPDVHDHGSGSWGFRSHSVRKSTRRNPIGGNLTCICWLSHHVPILFPSKMGYKGREVGKGKTWHTDSNWDLAFLCLHIMRHQG